MICVPRLDVRFRLVVDLPDMDHTECWWGNAFVHLCVGLFFTRTASSRICLWGGNQLVHLFPGDSDVQLGMDYLFWGEPHQYTLQSIGNMPTVKFTGVE